MKKCDDTYLDPKDLSRITHRSENWSYKTIAAMNKELEEMGYLTVRARIPRAYFEKRFLGFSAGGDGK